MENMSKKNPPIAFHIYRTRYSDLMYTKRVALQQRPNVFSLNEQVMRDTSTRLTTSLLFKPRRTLANNVNFL